MKPSPAAQHALEVLSLEAIQDAYRTTGLGACRSAWTLEPMDAAGDGDSTLAAHPCGCPAVAVTVARGAEWGLLRALDIEPDPDIRYGYGDPLELMAERLGIDEELLAAFTSGVDADMRPEFDTDREALWEHGQAVRKALQAGGYLKPDPEEDA